MLSNVVLVSPVQHESAISIHMSPPSGASLPPPPACLTIQAIAEHQAKLPGAQQLPTSRQSYTGQRMYVNATLATRPTLLFSYFKYTGRTILH